MGMEFPRNRLPRLMAPTDSQGSGRTALQAEAASRSRYLWNSEMDIGQYENAKFELADILRAALLAARAAQPENIYPFDELFARLAEDRFNVVVAGQFSRGKTSLVNAMLNTERLPTGIIPLTSVITTVQYGTAERVTMEYNERRLPFEIPIESLSEYITQRHNPGNVQGIRLARIELPSEILRRGFYLIDTPGLGSAIVENTRTTESFLPEADALIVVTSYDSPLSVEEMRLLADLASSNYRVFLVVNKQDLVSEAEKLEVQDHIRSQVRATLNEQRIEIFSLSARDAMAANRSSDRDRLVPTGLPHFIERLTQFLIAEKQSQFLSRMCQRIHDRVSALDGTAAELKRLDDLQERLGAPDDAGRDSTATNRVPGRVIPHFRSCQVCVRVEHAVREFLQKYQYEIIVNQKTRHELAESGGLCPFHTWQYAAIASPHGTCVGFPDLIDRVAYQIDEIAQNGYRIRMGDLPALLSTSDSCILCRARISAERAAITEVARLVTKAASDNAPTLPDICLQHLSRVASALPAPQLAQQLLAAEADSLGRVAEDMRRYALKRDGTRRDLTTTDEVNAHLRGHVALAGHSYLNFTRTLG